MMVDTSIILLYTSLKKMFPMRSLPDSPRRCITSSYYLSLRNQHNEMTKKARYCFFDTGIHNALIANFNPVELRNNISMLWENILYPRFVGEEAPRQVGP